MPDGSANVFSARPTLRIDGAQNDRVDATVIEMRMQEQVGGLSSLEVRLNDTVSPGSGTAAWAFADAQVLKLGAELRLYAGTVTAPQEIFRGRISALESDSGGDGPPCFVVLAEDALQMARRSRRSATYEAASPADVVRAVAGRLGVTANVEGSLDAPVCTWMQMNESDLSFLRRVLDTCDADLQMVADALQVGPRAQANRGSVDLTYGQTLRRVRITADLADVAPSVQVSGWDPLGGSAASGVATSGALGPGSGPAGTTLVAQALGVPAAEPVGFLGEMTQSEADSRARAIFSARARRFVRAHASADGDARLRVGTQVQVLGVNPLLATSFIITHAMHRFDQSGGYVTDFVAESAFMGTPAGAGG